MRHTILSALILWSAVEAQTQSPLTFEVASVKLSRRDRPVPFQYQFGPGEVDVRDNLIGFIVKAYGVEYYQVVGGPDWVRTNETYEVMAKSEHPASEKELRVMLQSLLAERFQLKLRRETRTVDGYVLVVDKNGSKLPPSRVGDPPDFQPQMLRGPFIRSTGGTMHDLARLLSTMLTGPVIDETKIEGRYDYQLEFDKTDADDFGGVTASLHQIGLKVERRKLPIEMIVIDSVERPSEN